MRREEKSKWDKVEPSMMSDEEVVDGKFTPTRPLVFAWLLCASFIYVHSRALDPLASFKAGSWLAVMCTDLSI